MGRNFLSSVKYKERKYSKGKCVTNLAGYRPAEAIAREQEVINRLAKQGSMDTECLSMLDSEDT
jgi:hypothetical protein